ncbi:MAG: class I tRNA ligase family protein [Mollicutes bacterium PWAP]|nr:class I tRNA ligase family protein [Mollicutes bacterium PWAP]
MNIAKKRMFTIKKISFMAILISLSVVFILIFTRFIPIGSIPSLKIGLGGLPIKTTGYLFGPIIGMITGLITDLISFAISPTFIHYWYILAFILTGIIPGLISFIMFRKWKKEEVITKLFESKKNYLNFIITIVILTSIIIGMTIFILHQPSSNFGDGFIKNKFVFLGIAIAGVSTMLIAVLIFWFVFKPKTINNILPIIAFSAILEICVLPLLALGDISTFNLKKSFVTILTAHLLISPIRIWVNTGLVYFAQSVIWPFIKNKNRQKWKNASQKELNKEINMGYLKNKKINIYVCGPTLYDSPHIGNMRPIITYDIYALALKELGYKVNFIHNITDIDDKIIKKSIEKNITELEISNFYLKEYIQLLKNANITTIKKMPNVANNIKGIAKYISSLKKMGIAYESNGSVYFDTSKVDSYGTLSGRKNKINLIEEINYDKKNQSDFALWKKTNIGIKFNSPFGDGRPGWHTECSYFIKKEFGKNGVHIHGGGVDLKFPHHENENAQHKSLFNKEISKKFFWTGHLSLENTKMSKSKSNVILAKDIKNMDLLRLLFLNSNPTGPINFNSNSLTQIQDELGKMKKLFAKTQLFNLKIKDEIILRELFLNISKFNFSEVKKMINFFIKDFNKNPNNLTASTLFYSIKGMGFKFTKKLVSKKDIVKYNKWKKMIEKKMYEEADRIRQELKWTNLM